MKAAEEAWGLSDYRRVVELYRDILPRFPDNYYVRSLLGRALDLARFPEQAHATLRDAVRLRPAEPLAWRFLGSLALRVKDYRRAVRYYRCVVRRCKDLPIDWVLLGVCHEKLGEREAEIATYREGLRHVQDFSLLENLGRALAERGLPRQAIRAYREAIVLAPAKCSGNALYGLAFEFCKLRRVEESVDLLRQAARLEPFTHIWDALVRVLEATGRDEEAREAVEHLRTLDPEKGDQLRQELFGW